MNTDYHKLTTNYKLV